MKARSTKAAVAAVICLLFFGGGQSLASPAQMLGEQDFADGAVVNFDSVFLSAQSNETGPSLGLTGRGGLVTWFHDGLDPGLPGTLTFSLWDLNSGDTGNQVALFWLDGVAQPVSQFETGRPARTVELFQYPVAASFLTDGQVQVLLQFGPSTGGFIGVDFSRLELVPEPASALLCGAALGPVAIMRRRK